MRFLFIILVLFSFNLNAAKFYPTTITCIQEDYNGMYSIMWVFNFNKDFTVLKSLSTENYSDFDDYFILNKVEGDKIYLNTRIEGNEFILNLATMTAKWDTIGGLNYYCRGRDLRSKRD
tara:strand:+ start:2501 stop:2857 length:357 start_codon:yes stop_codon:yes gene_type:complete